MREYVFERKDPYTRPILILGEEGSGKTTFARQIMEGRTITMIDTTYLRDMARLVEALRNLGKQNITQMMSSKRERGVIFDDIHVFCKEDPRGFAKICEVLQHPPKRAWIVATSHISSHKKKKIAKLPCEKISLILDVSERYRICKHLLQERHLKATSDEIDRMVHETRGIRELVERIEGKKNPIGDTPETLSTKHMESLNILEYAGSIVDQEERHRMLSYLYMNHVFCDQIETFVNIYHHWDMMAYPREMCSDMARYLGDTSGIRNKGNRYISKSLVCIGRDALFASVSPEIYARIYEGLADPEEDALNGFSPKQRKLLLETVRVYLA